MTKEAKPCLEPMEAPMETIKITLGARRMKSNPFDKFAPYQVWNEISYDVPKNKIREVYEKMMVLCEEINTKHLTYQHKLDVIRINNEEKADE